MISYISFVFHILVFIIYNTTAIFNYININYIIINTQHTILYKYNLFFLNTEHSILHHQTGGGTTLLN